MRSLNLDQLRAFIEVVERGSFTAAARELNLTQPAVTHQVQELERRFNVALVGRTELKGQRVAAFGCPHPRRSLTGEANLLAAKARLVADHGAGAALALQAVTHGDARWFALNRKVKLPAAAGGASSGHG